MSRSADSIAFVDLDPTEKFAEEVIDGLTQPRKQLPCKYLYDEQGSILFDRICELDDYYPTRTELRIMRDNVVEIVEQLGPRCLLIEFGSGSSLKTRILLDRMQEPAGYVPIDISREHLMKSVHALAAAYPQVDILPMCVDFHETFDVPTTRHPPQRRVVYHPGSTIGNCTPDEAAMMLRSIARLCGVGGGLLIGVDLKKDVQTLERAYNDSQGITAKFNLNILRRINRELDADFHVEAFEHKAIFNEELDRVEMHLLSKDNQTVTVCDEEIELTAGETIHTENSHKYDPRDFIQLATTAGWSSRKVWVDDDRLFSVHFLVVASSPAT